MRYPKAEEIGAKIDLHLAITTDPVAKELYGVVDLVPDFQRIKKAVQRAYGINVSRPIIDAAVDVVESRIANL